MGLNIRPMGVLSRLPNPNPANFKILKVAEIGQYIVLKLKYPDCTNYEGDKIIVFKDSLVNIMNCHEIDPHFNRGSTVVARFAPTDAGWVNACKFARIP